VRVAYLGPAGTYTHEALLSSAAAFARPADIDELAETTIHAVVMAVERGEADRGVVPIENSVEGSVNATLDALAFEAPGVQIVGETVLAIHHCLIGRPGLAVEQVELVLSHPQALAQCAGFVRSRLPGAATRAEASTAEAVRSVAEGQRPWAALGPRTAAERYGATVLVENVEDVAGNETRFAWLARSRPPSRSGRASPTTRAGSWTACRSSPGAGSTSRASSPARARSGSASTCSSWTSRVQRRTRL
jgi:prephenate dehydratase